MLLLPYKPDAQARHDKRDAQTRGMGTHFPRWRVGPISRARRGAIAAQTILSLTAIMLFLALLMDGGKGLSERRRAQAVADAAALAGAQNLFVNYPANQGKDIGDNAKSAALANASANGFSNDGVNSNVTVNIPPKSGSFQDATKFPGYIEVIVQANVPRIFSPQRLPVQARSVARGQWTGAKVGVLLLSPSASEALSITGKGSVSLTGGGSLVVNSSSSSSVSTGSGSVSVASPGQVRVDGGWSGTKISPAPVQSPPTPDPLRFLSAPNTTNLTTISQDTYKIDKIPKGGLTLSPGIYQGGISISADGKDPITFSPGIYFLAGGGLKVTGSADITGSGVVIYNGPDGSGTVGALDLAGSGNVALTPPTSGTYTGVGFFQARGATTAITLEGDASQKLSGTLYAPSARVTIKGKASSVFTHGQLICDTMSFTGDGSVNVNWSNSGVAPTRMLGPVE
jgi:hypothetical protein